MCSSWQKPFAAYFLWTCSKKDYNYFSNQNEILLALTEEYWRQALLEMKTEITAVSFWEQLQEIFYFLKARIDQSAGTLMNSLGNVELAEQAYMASMPISAGNSFDPAYGTRCGCAQGYLEWNIYERGICTLYYDEHDNSIKNTSTWYLVFYRDDQAYHLLNEGEILLRRLNIDVFTCLNVDVFTCLNFYLLRKIHSTFNRLSNTWHSDSQYMGGSYVKN